MNEVTDDTVIVINDLMSTCASRLLGRCCRLWLCCEHHEIHHNMATAIETKQNKKN